jgi:hypothetical protein
MTIPRNAAGPFGAKRRWVSVSICRHAVNSGGSGCDLTGRLIRFEHGIPSFLPSVQRRSLAYASNLLLNPAWLAWASVAHRTDTERATG